MLVTNDQLLCFPEPFTDQLADVVSQLIETGEAKHSKQGGKLSTGVHTLPKLRKDATDRNRHCLSFNMNCFRISFIINLRTGI